MNQEQKRSSTLAGIGALVALLLGIFIGYGFGVISDSGKLTNLQNTIAILESRIDNLNKQLAENGNKIPVTENQAGKWKAYNNEDFSILIPSDYDQGNLESATNNNYNLKYEIHNIDQIKNETEKSLIKQGKLREYEELRSKELCDKSSEPWSCKNNELSHFRNIDIKGGSGIEFILTMQGLNIGEQRGSTMFIYQTYIKENKEYRFWTQEKQPPKELADQYPKLDPTPIEMFKEIMKTIKID